MEGSPIVVNQEGDEEVLNLPPGFRFHPTDEEIITHYLTQKLVNPNFSATAIGEVDLNKCEPWDLPKRARMGEKEWFFFCQRDRKYPTGMRTNRATKLGYWKATGKDKEIYCKAKSRGGRRQLVGMKKTLVFYKGRAPKGEKSNWVMHEFRLDGNLSYHNFRNKSAAKDEWVVCKVFHKNAAMMNKKNSDLMRINSFVEGLLDSPLPSLMDSPCNTNANTNAITTTTHELEDLKGTCTILYPPSFSRASDGIFSNQMPMQQYYGYMTSALAGTNQQSSQYYNYDQNASFPSSSLVNYLHQQRLHSIPSNRALESQHCKVEQYSSNLSRSQDTGLSTEFTPEISSKKHVDYKEDVEGTSVGHLADLDSFWNFQ